MNNSIIAIGLIVVVLALIGWYEYSVWGECLEKNSWWYCFRILAK